MSESEEPPRSSDIVRLNVGGVSSVCGIDLHARMLCGKTAASRVAA